MLLLWLRLNISQHFIHRSVSRRYGLWFCLLCFAGSLVGQQHHYTLSPAIVNAYEDILRLELSSAQAQLSQIKAQEPLNLAAYHIENYIDFFRLYLTEDDELLKQLLPAREARIKQLEQLPTDSPWRNYSIAEVRLHWALIRLRFESYLPAFRDVNKAHKLLRNNARNFPDFLPTYKDLGLLHAAVGTIPPQFKWGVELLSSLKGSIVEGQAEMEKALADQQHPFYRETAVLYALLQLHLANEPEIAWTSIQALELKPATNPLHCFVVANLAMRSERNDLAIQVLSRQPRGGTAAPMPYLDFMLGLAKLRKLDYSARIYFQSFLLRFDGHHFIKEAQQKIAWAELLRGREDRYHERMLLVNSNKKTSAGGDLNASNEASRGTAPHQGLLRARLLFDGAYYERARQEVDAIDPAQLNSPELELEYYYRTGRILHGLQDYPGALSFYERTISLGQDAASFFACNAALQAGLIEEKRGQKALAKKYFELCLAMSPSEYRMGLHIQAKAGLNRL